MFRLGSRTAALRAIPRYQPTLGTSRFFHVSRSCHSILEPLAAAVSTGYPLGITLFAIAPHALRFFLIDSWKVRREIKVKEKTLPFQLADRALMQNAATKQNQPSIQEPLAKVTKHLTNRLEGSDVKYKWALFYPILFNIIWTAEVLWKFGGGSNAAQAVSGFYKYIKGSVEASLNDTLDPGIFHSLLQQLSNLLGSVSPLGLEIQIPAFVIAVMIVRQNWRYLRGTPFLAHLRPSFVNTWPSFLHGLFFWPNKVYLSNGSGVALPGWWVVRFGIPIIPALLGKRTRRGFYNAAAVVATDFLLALLLAANCTGAQLWFLLVFGAAARARVWLILHWIVYLEKRQPEHVRAWLLRARKQGVRA